MSFIWHGALGIGPGAFAPGTVENTGKAIMHPLGVSEGTNTSPITQWDVPRQITVHANTLISAGYRQEYAPESSVVLSRWDTAPTTPNLMWSKKTGTGLVSTYGQVIGDGTGNSFWVGGAGTGTAPVMTKFDGNGTVLQYITADDSLAYNTLYNNASHLYTTQYSDDKIWAPNSRTFQGVGLSQTHRFNPNFTHETFWTGHVSNIGDGTGDLIRWVGPHTNQKLSRMHPDGTYLWEYRFPGNDYADSTGYRVWWNEVRHSYLWAVVMETITTATYYAGGSQYYKLMQINMADGSLVKQWKLSTDTNINQTGTNTWKIDFDISALTMDTDPNYIWAYCTDSQTATNAQGTAYSLAPVKKLRLH